MPDDHSRATSSHDEFGAWLLRCKPETLDIDTFIDQHRRTDTWNVPLDVDRNEQMEIGDPVVLWVTGEDPAPMTPGIWGIGAVVGPPAEVYQDDGLESYETTDRSRIVRPGNFSS